MFALLAAVLLVQDPPPDPPASPAASAPPLEGEPPPGAVEIEWNGADGPASWVVPRADGSFPPAFVPTAPGGLRLMGDRIVLHSLAPPRPAGPFAGTLKLTAPDGAVTEYRAEFTPDPPAAEQPPRFQLGIVLTATEPSGDPPGLTVGTVRPAESAEIAAERAAVRFEEAKAQLEQAAAREERIGHLAEHGVASDREIERARAKTASARAEVRRAELDRRAAEERIEADRRRRAAETAAAEARLRAARAQRDAVGAAHFGELREAVRELRRRVEEQAAEIKRLTENGDE